MSLLIQQNVPLADLTTFRIGGKALFFVSAKTETDVIEAVEYAKEKSLPLFILGGGSNVLISDSGFNGLVLRIELKGIERNGEFVTAKAGEDWDDFVKYCVSENLQGVECLSGIPGFVGGTPVQNVGAYGQEVSESIKSVKCFDRENLTIVELNADECGFGYRTSIFNTSEINRFIVLAVTFQLKENVTPKVVYKDLIEYFENKTPNLTEMREAVCRIRSEKAMLVRQGGIDSQSAGSFFKNPIISKAKHHEISEKYGSPVPSYRVDDLRVKIPAAWLIEKSGFEKGYQKANAGLSNKHTLALINRGNASANEILNLKAEIQDQVRLKFNIEIYPEPIFVGFE